MDALPRPHRRGGRGWLPTGLSLELSPEPSQRYARDAPYARYARYARHARHARATRSGGRVRLPPELDHNSKMHRAAREAVEKRKLKRLSSQLTRAVSMRVKNGAGGGGGGGSMENVLRELSTKKDAVMELLRS